ncbi:M81 family metallopeptidase [Proteinivorax tanatarense]|uniref:M81 family metallopeptidase n=1 Tax=Proteinivorax tanatarense TaxID=1260629 RepID=A0AAU7VNV2_9FIRM
MKRVLVGGMYHESNSFNPIITKEKDFKVIYGKEIFESIKENDAISGIITTLQEAECEVVPTVYARAVPNGEVDYDFYIRIKDEIIEKAKKADAEKPLDGITLALHGSMRVKELGEAEGDILKELSSLFPNIPIYSALDMHATITSKMHNNCNGFVGYKCAPHTDCTETGIQAAKMTIKSINNQSTVKSCWVKIPLIIAGEQSATADEPMAELIEGLKRMEKKAGILSASYFMGFPWADNKDNSAAAYVVAENDEKLAQQTAVQLAEKMWEKRYEFKFHTETYSQQKALNKAFEAVCQGETPVYISDSGDNPTAGASSDCTEFLKIILADKRLDSLERPIIYGGFYDPEAVKQCKGKVGEIIDITFGAKFDATTSTPINATGTVKSYISGWGGITFPQSDIVLFNTGGVDVILAEQHIGYTDPKLYIDLGLNPKEAQIIVCKLGYLTPQHEALAKRSILALTKGNTNEELKSIEFKKIERPIFPLDEKFNYKAVDNVIKREKGKNQ